MRDGYEGSHICFRGFGNGPFTQKDYLAQILRPYIMGFLKAFKAVCGTLQLMEDGNSAHGHKSIQNPYAVWRATWGITGAK